MVKRPFVVLSAVLALASCSVFESGPSEQDIEKIFGFGVHDNSCVAASGKPGYMCTFTTDGQNWTITRRIIKTEGGWKAVDGN